MKRKIKSKAIILGQKKPHTLETVFKEHVKTTSLNNKAYLKFLKLKEMKERKNSTKQDFLYPDFNDPDFNVKISSKKEFYDTKYDKKIYNVKKRGNQLCSETEFELSPTQMFVRNFLSFQTPYNNLLLYHGLGTGKTCSAISVCEEMRKFMKEMDITKRIIIVASPNVQENFKLQLFDERNLKNIDGLWNIRACTGNSLIKEINPMYMKGFTKQKVISQIKRIINVSYLFLGYSKFSNYIEKILLRFSKEKKAIETEFSDRLIVIDEAHNIRSTADNKEKEKKKVGKNLLKLVKYTKNLKLLLLSATPMFNSYKEIVWLLNLMNLNDHRYPITVKELFDSDGNFLINEKGKEIGKELLIQKSTGYISYVRGENPYTFPYRIFPSVFSKENTIKDYPKKQTNDAPIKNGIEFLDLFICPIGEHQETAFFKVIEDIKNKIPSFNDIEKGMGYTILEPPLQVLNMSYPSDDCSYGQSGLDKIMLYNKSTMREFKYRNTIKQNFGRIFAPENIAKYSGKINSIMNVIHKSKGIVLIYSQYISGGCVPIALALEEIGFARLGGQSLFKTSPTGLLNPITMKKRKVKTEPIASYIMITGQTKLSPRNAQEVNAATDLNNINGENVKVIIISKAGSEGLDFKNIRQVHILEPWYNINRIEQIIGRAIRFCSHAQLPFKERNCEIYLYGTQLTNSDIEATDLYVYRLAEKKAIQIARVARVLKQNAVDCLLNTAQMNLSAKKLKQRANIHLSTGKKIIYQIGDQPFSSICDYVENCDYKCHGKKITKINMDTYNENFIIMNIEKIIRKIRNLFKEHYIYKKNHLITAINRIKKYPLIQIYAALNQLITDKNEYISDILGRNGFLVNIGEYYMFQPIELENKHITRFSRVHPIDYKRNKLDIILPDKIIQFKGEDNRDVDILSIINKMKQHFRMVQTPQDLLKNKNNWYAYCSWAVERLKNQIPIKSLFKYCLEHIIEIFNSNKKELVEYLYFKNELTDFEQNIKNYFDKYIIKSKRLTAILLKVKNKENNSVFIFDKKQIRNIENTEWLEIQCEFQKKFDYSDRRMNPLEDEDHFKECRAGNIDDFNDIVGFMAEFKKEYIIFKVKDLNKKRNKGARCDQISKKHILPVINKIIKDKEYTNENIIQPGSTKKVSTQQLCCELELILRHYDNEQIDNKRWFLSPEESTFNNIETKNKN